MTKVFVNLEDIQDSQNARFIDTRFDLADATMGKKLFAEGHIAGAVYWDLEQDLSDMDSKSGRHPMISKEKMTSLVQQSGLQLEDTIYIYDQGGAPFALRAYFLLEWAGFVHIYVLRDGYEEIKKVLPTTTEITAYAPSTVTPKWKDELIVDVTAVEEVVAGKTKAQLIDARAAKRFRGEFEPIDPIAGHIPTAINYDWEQLKKDGQFSDSEEMKNKLANLTPKDAPIIAYCGSGVTAAPLYASLKEAGYPEVKIYVGSYSDWIREHEVETEL